jgi:hypothetical protein
MELKLIDYVHDEKLTLLEFIYCFLMSFNEKYRTVYADHPEVIQCDISRSRSLGDITAIAKHYYPDTNEAEVKEILLDFGENLVGHVCGDIDKRVYAHKHLQYYWNQMSEDELDEYGKVTVYRTEDKNKSVLSGNKNIEKFLTDPRFKY